MKIAILGAGAIGGYYGARLADAGHEVGFVARGETLEQLRTTGLTIVDASDEQAGEVTRVVQLPAAETFVELAGLLGGIDVAVIATKILPGNANFGDLAQLRALGDEYACIPILTTHNSVEVHYLAAKEFGIDRILAGVVRAYITKEGPARLRRNPGPFHINFGPLFAGMEGSAGPEGAEGAKLADAQRGHTLDIGKQLRAALDDAGCGGRILPDIAVDIWSKAMYVTTTGVLGALSSQPLGYLRTTLRPELRGLMAEVEAAARAHGVDLPESVVERTLGFADSQWEDATSSMHRDIEAGLPNELDSQAGAIRRMAVAAGVATPLFDLCQKAIEARFGL